MREDLDIIIHELDKLSGKRVSHSAAIESFYDVLYFLTRVNIEQTKRIEELETLLSFYLRESNNEC